MRNPSMRRFVAAVQRHKTTFARFALEHGDLRGAQAPGQGSVQLLCAVGEQRAQIDSLEVLAAAGYMGRSTAAAVRLAGGASASPVGGSVRRRGIGQRGA
jgi:hypothetical protein